MEGTHSHLVIVAGGVGSRFWPMSTSDKPKQFIDVLGVGKSPLQLTLDRFSGLRSPDHVWILTNKEYFHLVRQQLPDVPVENILQEPMRRNAAPCIAYVSWHIKSCDPQANIVVTPSDHVVTNGVEFQRVIKSCLTFTNEADTIITLGMRPNRPEIGYGYIQAGLTSSSLRNKELFRVDRFREKPDLQTAQEYIEQSNFFWNAGISIQNAKTIVNIFRVCMPAMAKIFESMTDIYGTKGEQNVIDERYGACENVSIDYAILEKPEEVFVCPTEFGWSDLGTWSSLFQQAKRDLYGSDIIGENISSYGTHNCIVHATQAKQVVIQGPDDCAVAEKNGVLLICELAEEQRIKQFSGEN